MCNVWVGGCISILLIIGLVSLLREEAYMRGYWDGRQEEYECKITEEEGGKS